MLLNIQRLFQIQDLELSWVSHWYKTQSNSQEIYLDPLMQLSWDPMDNNSL